MDDLISTREAATLLGVGPTAIKRWADSGDLPCQRTAGGHRRFLRRDLANLIQNRSRANDAELEDAPPGAGTAAGGLVDMMLADDGAYRAEGRLMRARGECGSWMRAASLVGDALAELGRRWQAGQISILQEHLASARLGRALSRIAASIPVPPKAPRALLVTAPGDDHTLGLGLVELCLLEAGWRCHWAGRATPAEEVIAHVDAGEVAMVVASASSSSANEAALASWMQTVGAACTRNSVDLIVGGSGAWPEHLSYAVRLRDFEQLNAYLAGARSR